MKQLKPFLPGQPRNDPKDRDIRLVGKAHLAQQGLLVFFFPGQFASGILERNKRIGFRAPFLVIYSVEDAYQVGAAHLQNRMQAGTVFPGLDLLSIGFADGRDHIAVQQAGFEVVDHVPGEVLLGQEVTMVAQAELVNHLGGKDALVADIVNGQHGFGAGEQLVPAVERLQV